MRRDERTTTMTVRRMMSPEEAKTPGAVMRDGRGKIGVLSRP
jgi:hypothetical protein